MLSYDLGVHTEN